MKIVKQENRELWADYLRAIATVSVIFVHVSSDAVVSYNNGSSFVWWIGNIYDSTFRFCVPIFVMLTGSLLLPKEIEIRDFLKKKLFRIIFPLVFWSIIYILYSLSVTISNGDPITLHDTGKDIFEKIMKGSSFHFWYVYMIIGLYLFIPIIGKWVRNCSEKEILYFLVIWGCTLFFNLPIISKLKPNINLSYFSGYLGYLILGYYLSTKSFEHKQNIRRISIGLIILGIVITAFGTFFISCHRNQFVQVFYSYLTPNVLIASIGLFMFFKTYHYSVTRRNVIVNFIAKYSYGIYLVHILVLTFLGKYGVTWNFINPVFAIPITSFICLCLSGTIIYFLNRLPYGKYISG
ncbi:MAG: acyltransferase family protein [Bacteroidetes bacterium]|nr:acyltransferase family protein [Bacteroidota bacterium]